MRIDDDAPEGGDFLRAIVRPTLRQRIHLQLDKWNTSLPSRVEEVLDLDLVVDLPEGLTAAQEPEPGDKLVISWEDLGGSHLLPCEVVSLVARELPRLRVVPTGPTTADQRRRHVRAPTDSVITVVRGHDALPAKLLDLSEGGMRAVFQETGAAVGAGEIVSAIVPIEGEMHDLRAQIVRVWVTPGEPRTFSSSFLDLATHEADALRGHVFAEQMRARARTIS